MGLIQRLLSKSNGSVIRDKTTFEKYKLGQISLEQCMQEFYKNNYVRNEDQILTKAMFKEWLEGIGYRGL